MAMKFHILPVGADALLVELESAAQARRAYRALRSSVDAGWLPRPRDLVPAARTVLVDGVSDAAALAVALREFVGASDEPIGEVVEVALMYDGEDLADVARHWDCEEAEVIERHQAATFEVAFTGFAPGFAYLVADGWPEVTRRETPRTKVPAGSVALAGPYCGVYPRSMPGGWQLIGHSDVELFFPDRDPPALLRPGDRVRFVT